MAETKASKDLQEKQTTAMAEYAGYADMQGAGFENQSADDYTIPFIQLLQALSPQVEENDALKAGMILNSVTGEVVSGKEGVVFVPATTQHTYIEWRPRESGGGFVATHEVNSDVVRNCIQTQDFGAYTTDEGNDLVETFSVYGLCLDGQGQADQAVLSFTSKKIKKYKAWMTRAKTIQIKLADGRRIPAPLFAHKYRLTSVSEKAPKGQFYNWNIKFDGDSAIEARLPADSPIVEAAAAIRELLDSGKARAAYESTGANA